METVAAVMTGKGTGAIATISLFGPDADNILRKIFNPSSKLKAGQTALGAITVNGNVIDQVLIGCEGADNFTINCHGNPLIVSDILRLLEKKGASTVSTEQLLVQKYSQMSTIAIEAKLAMADIKTLDGTRIVSNQIEGGLTKAVKSWQQTVENGSLEKVRPEAKTILQNSKKTRPSIYGCKIVLAGAPNSGKSTLLNRLAGKEKAIVTDIKGTTRDWVSTDCQFGKLSAEVIDTAGLDEALSADETIDSQAQQKAYEILNDADLVLVVLDISEQKPELSDRTIRQLKDKVIVLVLNKCDLPAKLDKAKLPVDFGQAIEISAKYGTGIGKLISHIQQIFRVDVVDSEQAVCFTTRQEQLLSQIADAQSPEDALSAIAELLNGQVHV